MGQIMVDKLLEGNVKTIYKVCGPVEAVVGGYGAYGILLENSEGKIQCHICGKWFDFLSSHISVFHKIPVKKYKEMYGFTNGTALCSSNVSEKLSIKACSNNNLINSKIY